MNEKLEAVALMGLLGTLSLAVGEASALQCGDTVLPGQKVALEQNVGPCTPESGGITVVGPAKLDLNGFSVTCLVHSELHLNPAGLTVIGERAKIRNGRVLACRTGVEVGGQGGHRIQQVQVALSAREGFRLESNRNVLKDDSAIQNGGDGFVVHGERNTLKKNLSSDNGRFGFVVDGSRHRIVRNETVDDGWGGILVYGNGGQGPSKIIRNVASAPDGEFDIAVTSQAVCAENVWKANLFGTKSHECIR